MVPTPGKKGGPGIGYSGHKHQKGDKELTIVENRGFVIGPLSVQSINQQDTVILPDTLTALVDFTNRIGIDLWGSALTLEPLTPRPIKTSLKPTT